MNNQNTSRADARWQPQGTEALLRTFLSLVPRRDQELANLLVFHRNSHIWIFGAAGIGISVKRWLVEKHYKVYAFCDNAPQKVGTLVDGIPVRSFSDLVRDRDRVVLIAIWKYFDEIARQCAEAGIPFLDGTLLSGVVFDTIQESVSFVSGNLPRITNIYQKLADGRSAEIYTTAQAARIFRKRGAMGSYRSPAQYIEPEIAPLGRGETVFICGAGNGAAAIEVDRAALASPEIHLFEPDSENFSSLCRRMGHIPNVRCVESGVGHRSERLPFCGGMGENATFSLPGEQTAAVTAIDDYVERTGAVPSFITMDIEGWELEALRGAEKTILRHRPRLAVSLYHRASDFVNIPEFVLGLRPDYSLYVRHYTDSYSDTIAYFV